MTNMKQKMVIKVQMENARQRSKALKVVAGFSGVVSTAIEGGDKGQITVVGEGVDLIDLTSSLRKKMGSATLVTVVPIEEEKKGTKVEMIVNPSNWSYSYPVVTVPQYHYGNAVCYDRSEDNCSIM